MKTTIVLLIAMFLQSPPVAPKGANLPPAPLGADPLEAAGTVVQVVAESMKAWESDELAQYEQRELAAVRADLALCMSATAKTPQEFIEHVTRLQMDAAKLVERDDQLKRDLVI